MAIDWTNKKIYVLEFKRTSDQRSNYRSRAEARAAEQHDVLIKSLKEVFQNRFGRQVVWDAKLITFVGGTCGSVNVDKFNEHLEELQVSKGKYRAIRKGLVYELLHAQDKVLCSYFAQRNGHRGAQAPHGASLWQSLMRLPRWRLRWQLMPLAMAKGLSVARGMGRQISTARTSAQYSFAALRPQRVSAERALALATGERLEGLEKGSCESNLVWFSLGAGRNE